MTQSASHVGFSEARVTALLESLEWLAAGDTRARLALSPLKDELDAIAFGINVLADELRWTSEQMREAERVRAEELRRSKEAAEHASESKSVFVRNASHEIKTPIAVILLLAELLARSDVSNEERADLLRQLRANSQAVLALVGSLLDLSKLEAGQPTLTIEPISVLELVREVVQSLEPQARKKGLSVRIEVDGALPIAVETDELRLRQVLVNLIGNALKFTNKGGVSITLSRAGSSDSHALRFDIADTGAGIAPDRHDNLFQPFELAELSPARFNGGTGLGLAISRHLAEQLGGTLELLESGPGRGSTFRLTITATPVDQQEPEILAITTAVAETSSSPLAGVHILFADDRADLQVAVRRLLRAMGATVDSARNGREAMAMAMSQRYDILLMDILMPEIDGLEAARAIRRTGLDLPIIAVTGDATTAWRQAAVEAGCSALLSKPFDSQHLLASIDVALRRHRSEQIGVRS